MFALVSTDGHHKLDIAPADLGVGAGSVRPSAPTPHILPANPTAVRDPNPAAVVLLHPLVESYCTIYASHDPLASPSIDRWARIT